MDKLKTMNYITNAVDIINSLKYKDDEDYEVEYKSNSIAFFPLTQNDIEFAIQLSSNIEMDLFLLCNNVNKNIIFKHKSYFNNIIQIENNISVKFMSSFDIFITKNIVNNLMLFYALSGNAFGYDNPLIDTHTIQDMFDVFYAQKLEQKYDYIKLFDLSCNEIENLKNSRDLYDLTYGAVLNKLDADFLWQSKSVRGSKYVESIIIASKNDSFKRYRRLIIKNLAFMLKDKFNEHHTKDLAFIKAIN